MTEQEIQTAVVQHLKLRGVKGLCWFSVPNGARRNIVDAVNLKRTGTRAGVADIILLHNSQSYALELKTESGRASEAQMAFLLEWHSAGGFWQISYGLDNAIDVLTRWGLLS